VPEDYHDACCIKHHKLRLQAEAEGRQYSRFDNSAWEEVICVADGAIAQVRATTSA
jgi:hypothetical protein